MLLKQDRTLAYIREQKMLDEETLRGVLKEHEETHQSLLGLLRKKDLLTDDQITRVVAVTNGIDYVDITPEMVDPIAAHMVPYETVKKHKLIPIKREGNKLIVAMSAPLNIAVRDQIEIRTGCKVIPLAAPPDAIKNTIRQHFNVQTETKQAIASMRLKQDTEKKSEDIQLQKKTERVSSDPITKLVSSIIGGAIDARASDIHIEPQISDLKVRYRVDGILHNAINVPSSVQNEVISHIKILGNMDISEKRIPQDGHISVSRQGLEYDLRTSSLPTVEGEKIVMRILDKSSSKWTLESVVPSSHDYQLFQDLLKNPYGMLLVTGPTGSGKTTTLYSILQQLNTPERNIVTVADPVEYKLEGINQVQINPNAGRPFASALKSILRQDPDVVFVGEIRDLETAEIAVSAALTGHLVLSTLHTNDASGAVSRLINIGVQPFLVASALLGAVAQRLTRTICPKCGCAAEPDERLLKHLSSLPEYSEDKLNIRKGKGCQNCNNKGFMGRKAVYEILTISQEIKKLTIQNCGSDSIKQQAIKEGMHTLKKAGLLDVMEGFTTLQELERVIDLREE